MVLIIIICNCWYTQGTIEEKIFQRQVTKQGLSVVMDGDSNRDMKKKNKSKAASNIQFSLEELKVCAAVCYVPI